MRLRREFVRAVRAHPICGVVAEALLVRLDGEAPEMEKPPRRRVQAEGHASDGGTEEPPFETAVGQALCRESDLHTVLAGAQVADPCHAAWHRWRRVCS